MVLSTPICLFCNVGYFVSYYSQFGMHKQMFCWKQNFAVISFVVCSYVMNVNLKYLWSCLTALWKTVKKFNMLFIAARCLIPS